MLQRFLIIFCILSSFVFAQSFSFKETRYSDVFQKKFLFLGFISFKKEQTIIEYIEPEKKLLVYFEERVSLQDEHAYRMIDFTDAPSLHYLFLLIRALYEKDRETVSNFFDWDESEEIVHLSPLNEAKEVLHSVDVYWVKDKLRSLHIKMQNKDWILIEIHE